MLKRGDRLRPERRENKLDISANREGLLRFLVTFPTPSRPPRSAEEGASMSINRVQATAYSVRSCRRSRFQRRLTRGVDMTSHVKNWLAVVVHLLYPLDLGHRKRRSQSDATVDPAEIRGLGPT
jgi:hypothetical protein